MLLKGALSLIARARGVGMGGGRGGRHAPLHSALLGACQSSFSVTGTCD